MNSHGAETTFGKQTGSSDINSSDVIDSIWSKLKLSSRAHEGVPCDGRKVFGDEISIMKYCGACDAARRTVMKA